MNDIPLQLTLTWLFKASFYLCCHHAKYVDNVFFLLIQKQPLRKSCEVEHEFKGSPMQARLDTSIEKNDPMISHTYALVSNVNVRQ